MTTTKTRCPAVDAYIARAPAYAHPILEKIREAFHSGCPELEERIKWGHPSFEYKGILGGMAAFKKHVTFGFWKARLLEDFHHIFTGAPRASAMGARASAIAELPARKAFVACVREAKRLNDEGVREPRAARPKRSIRVPVPADLLAALARHPKARATFAGFPPGQKREYVAWITEAKREQTRAARIATSVQWMAEGKRRNWKYERKS